MSTDYIAHFIVDRYHVGTSDRELLDMAIEDVLKPGAWDSMPPERQADFAHGCIDAHHENMDLYRQVMGGM